MTSSQVSQAPTAASAIDWMKRGACRGTDPDIFFPVYDADSSTAYPKTAYCDRCPVRVQCLDFALATDQRGIWGGTSEADRRALRRPRKRATCIGCRSTEILEEAHSEICLACGLTWMI